LLKWRRAFHRKPRKRCNGLSTHELIYTFRMTIESPAEFSARANQLLKDACPTREDRDFFGACMGLAKAQGMSWVEGLEYTVRCRRASLN
jgi:hypothetical protein